MSAEHELELLAEELQRQTPPQARVGIEEIRPAMSEQDKTRVMDEILRVLRGEE